MGDINVGTCSECGGRVVVPDNWLSVEPPIPTCKRCGATAKQPHGPVIPMNPPDKAEDGLGKFMKAHAETFGRDAEAKLITP